MNILPTALILSKKTSTAAPSTKKKKFDPEDLPIYFAAGSMLLLGFTGAVVSIVQAIIG